MSRAITTLLTWSALALFGLMFGWTGSAAARSREAKAARSPAAKAARSRGGKAARSPAAKVVRYRGYQVVVPRSWPVYNLAADPTVCVRFNRHAVYLGQPNAAQRCPAHAAGRTEALLEQPVSAHDASAARPALVPASNPAAQGPGSMTRMTIPAHGLVVTATWGHQPEIVARALGLRAVRASTAAAAPAPRARALRAHLAGAAGGVYTGLGFDACSAPSAAHMSAWQSSPYRAVGVYIGGANMACAQPNLTASWVSQESGAGWHLIPTYVGLQAPTNSCGCDGIKPSQASAEGVAAAADAIAQAQALGIGAGNPIYFDMESYTRSSTNTSAVLTFLSAWTSRLHSDGYRSGVYSSADSGVADLVNQMGTGYPEPDDIWIADWNGEQTTSDPSVPGSDWDLDQRIHQYEGAHNETHGRVTINIDGDYLNGATAGAPASIAPDIAPYPLLTVSPQADGSTDLRASWTGTSNVSAWQLLAGPSPQSLAPFGSMVRGSGAGTAIVLHSEFPYFAVEALASDDQVLATSPTVATPAHLAIYGRGVYVSPGGIGGLPTGCFIGGTCHVATTISAGRTVIARTGRELVPTDGGLVMFGLSRTGRGLLARAADRRLAVRITVRDASGPVATSTSNLIPFVSSGPSPAGGDADPPTLRLVGDTEFVSNGVVGGVLTGCSGAAPCQVRTKVRAGGVVIASAGEETLGANELGYVLFKLTPRGRTLLAHARGNQLAAQVRLNETNGSASGKVALVSFH